MATFQEMVIGGTPDSSGNAGAELSTSFDTNDLSEREVMVLYDGGTGVIAFILKVPQNYNTGATTGPRMKIVWRSPASSGDGYFLVRYRSIADTESGDPSTWQETLGPTAITTSGALNMNIDSGGTATKTNFAAGDIIMVEVERQGGHASDTLSASVVLEAFIFEYDDA